MGIGDVREHVVEDDAVRVGAGIGHVAEPVGERVAQNGGVLGSVAGVGGRGHPLVKAGLQDRHGVKGSRARSIVDIRGLIMLQIRVSGLLHRTQVVI